MPKTTANIFLLEPSKLKQLIGLRALNADKLLFAELKWRETRENKIFKLEKSVIYLCYMLEIEF